MEWKLSSISRNVQVKLASGKAFLPKIIKHQLLSPIGLIFLPFPCPTLNFHLVNFIYFISFVSFINRCCKFMTIFDKQHKNENNQIQRAIPYMYIYSFWFIYVRFFVIKSWYPLRCLLLLCLYVHEDIESQFALSIVCSTYKIEQMVALTVWEYCRDRYDICICCCIL